MITLTVFGGSSVATPELIDALGEDPELDVDVVLHGRSADKLRAVAAVCEGIAGNGVRVRATTDLEAALAGAHIVLNQIRAGGFRARLFDETFPREFGLPGEETMGPGGFANAWRTVPAVLDLARAVERISPEAWVINLTNPSSVVQLALHRATSLRVLGVCDSPAAMVEHIAALLQLPPRQIAVEYVGMHHFGWITHVHHRGRDRIADVLAQVAALPWTAAPPELVQAIGAVPHPYLNYVLVPRTMLQRQQEHRPRAETLLELEETLVKEYRRYAAERRSGIPEAARRRNAIWYRKIIIPVIRALTIGPPGAHIVNFRNGAIIPWLPADTVIEGCALVSREGPQPMAPRGPVPADAVAQIQRNSAYESLLVDAIAERSFRSAWRAMSLNPLVRDAAEARALVERIWGNPN
jgi:6-phospho-beta-glucosidase